MRKVGDRVRFQRKGHLSEPNLLILLRVVILIAGLGILIVGLHQFTNRQKITITAPAIILRQQATPSSSAVTTINGTKTVTKVGEKNGWYHVIVSGHRGWVPSWLIHSNYNATSTSNHLAEETIVIDAGHGGSDSGALSTSNAMEKTYTLKMALALQQQLKNQYTRVIMTRSSDQTVALASRPALANKDGANLFISFHFDSTDTANTASGFTAYYYHSFSKSLAATLSKSLNALALTNRGTAYGNFQVIRDSTMPAVLLEMGYINSDTDFTYIQSANYQKVVAELVTDGLKTYTKS